MAGVPTALSEQWSLSLILCVRAHCNLQQAAVVWRVQDQLQPCSVKDALVCLRGSSFTFVQELSISVSTNSTSSCKQNPIRAEVCADNILMMCCVITLKYQHAALPVVHNHA